MDGKSILYGTNAESLMPNTLTKDLKSSLKLDREIRGEFEFIITAIRIKLNRNQKLL